MEYRVADLFELGPATFDLVVSFHVIEHLPDPRAFLQRCAALTTSGGSLAVVTPNSLRLDNRLRRLLGRPPTLLDPQHFDEYSPAQMRRLAKEAGLDHVATIGGALRLLVPKVNRQVIPERLGRALGARLPAGTSTYAAVFRDSGHE